MEETKIYQQIDSQSFHIGTSANEEWFINKMGALDVEAPVYDNKTQKARWIDGDWVIKIIAEWETELKNLV
jgi:hypothetical protein